MRMTNDDPGPETANDAFAELLRLQGEFQARLADETLRYLRRLQATTGPSNPGTVVRAAVGAQLEASTQTSERIEFALEVENRQAAYVSVAPALTPLIGDDGTSWFPAADVRPASTLLPPEEVVEIVVIVDVPEQLPAGRYRGALLLPGFREDALPVVIEVQGGDEPVREEDDGPGRETEEPPSSRPTADQGTSGTSSSGPHDDRDRG
jgi:hypothetical protein